MPLELTPVVLPTIDEITIADLTTATIEGDGVFDVLMRANKAHLEQEFMKSRLRGPEYSTVYLGSLQSVLQTSLAFLLERQKAALGLYLVQAQIRQAELELLKTQVELQILEASLLKIPYEIELLQAQAALAVQQRLNLISENLGIIAKTAMTVEQTANVVVERTVLVATECVKRAEFDLIMQNVLKAVQETALLLQKKVTETAQTQGTASPDSQMGRQNSLYLAQTTGYQRDAEQKAAKILVDTWNARKVSDDTTPADPAGVGDTAVAAVVNKLRAGIGA